MGVVFMVLKWIDRLSEYVAKIFRWFGVALTLVTLYEVFCRYVLVRPTIWAFDVTMILNAAFFLFGGALLTKQDAHIKVDVLYDKFPKKAKKTVDFLYYAVLYIPLCVVMVWFGTKSTYQSFLIREISNTSQWGQPIWYWKAIIPLAFFFMLLQGLAQLIRIFHTPNETADAAQVENGGV
ncbi:MAG: TRAP transporter small permease subunit [Bacillota bacterium]|jgi:TRAP-type mannitol/chloroaromatic compound transport system permease small subunit